MGQQASQKDASITVNNTVPLVTYNGSFVDATTTANPAIQVFSAAQNTNGAIIEFASISMGTQTVNNFNTVTLLAKATAPSSATDGEAILAASCLGGNGAAAQGASENVILPVRVKIPAGKGLYVSQQAGGGGGGDRCVKTILYTLLT